ncbi:hypothetical protein C5B96_12810 [Subtercola sp. Z020]|uniref:hypothetical protein n=1 Tax=Subtercola sp. Z020 TaxID=2080582 RepID=UPI000CE7FD76|nr:hypothetical protein [Subtercola sp. Z020]PPF79435.1 hypothetical protein C5B96_12810 [Subtercola sp. Z020]
MSAPRPRRLSPKVYRRRRALALLVLVVVVVAVLLVILKPWSPGASATPGAAQNGASGTPVSGTASSGAPASGGSASTPPVSTAPSGAASTGAASTDAATDGTAACAAGNITVTAITDANTYPSGANPELSFSIVNTGSSPCTINAGTSKQVYTISSGSETYWVSTDCQTGASDTPAMLAPGVAVTSTPFPWNRVRSSPSTCAGSQTAVPAGGASYHLQVSVDGIASTDTAQFLLN